LIKRDQRAPNGNVWGHDKEECGDQHNGSVAFRQSRPVHEMCRCAKTPSANDKVQQAKRQECPWSDQNDEELCCATNQRDEQHRGEQGEEWRSKERCLSTVATEPVPGARKHRSEQGGANK
jgi:hypothetical protein